MLQTARPRSSHVASIVASLAGFGLTLWVFWPGVVNYDAGWIYEDIKHGRSFGDWQSPVMGALWRLLISVFPGPPPLPLFLISTVTYWLAYGLFALILSRRSMALGLIVPILAVCPPASLLVGILWRDVFMANAWLLACVLVLAASNARAGIRVAAKCTALMLLCYGVLLRPNAALAAPVLVSYIFWPTIARPARIVALYVPVVAVSFLLMQIVFYGWIGAVRQHVHHAILVFDLGGLTALTGQNQFPVGWTPDQERRLKSACYDASQWDGYWRLQPCPFVMQTLEQKKLFGSPELMRSWLEAIAGNPLAYLRHRAGHFASFLTVGARTMALEAWWIVNPPPYPSDRLRPIIAINEVLKATPLFSLWPWFGLNVLLLLPAWRLRQSTLGNFAWSVSASATVYILAFFLIGVASDFRYGFWLVLADVAAAIALWAARSNTVERASVEPLQQTSFLNIEEKIRAERTEPNAGVPNPRVAAGQASESGS
jgi:hypothetical protein